MAAAQGAPVPTATVLPSSRYRDAMQIISSIMLYSGVISLGSFASATAQSSTTHSSFCSSSILFSPPQRTTYSWKLGQL